MVKIELTDTWINMMNIHGGFLNGVLDSQSHWNSSKLSASTWVKETDRLSQFPGGLQQDFFPKSFKEIKWLKSCCLYSSLHRQVVDQKIETKG